MPTGSKKRQQASPQAPPPPLAEVSSDSESGELQPQDLPQHGSVPPPAAGGSVPPQPGTPSTNAVFARLEQQMQAMQQQMQQMQQQMQQQLSTLFAAQALGASTSQATLAPSPAAHTQHAGSARPPDPSQDNIFHAQATADRKQRDALETIRRLAPYEGPESEAYSTPFDFIQAIERIVYHQHADAHLRDEQVISQIASILQYDALGWFNASFPSGSMALELRSWPLFRAAFLAEHVDQQQVYRAADDLVGTDRIRMLVPSVFALENYDRQFRRILNTLSTSATMGQPNASGPPNDKWTTLIYYTLKT